MRLLGLAMTSEGLPPSVAYLEVCLGVGREPSGEGGSRSLLPEDSSLHRGAQALGFGHWSGCECSRPLSAPDFRAVSSVCMTLQSLMT